MFPANRIDRAFIRKGFGLLSHSRFTDNMMDKTHIEKFKFSKYFDIVEVSFCIHNSNNYIKYIESICINDVEVDDIERFCSSKSNCFPITTIVRDIITFIRKVMKRKPKVEIAGIHYPDNNGIMIRKVSPQLFDCKRIAVQPLAEPIGLKFAMKFLVKCN